jgi:hypothetical protein
VMSRWSPSIQNTVERRTFDHLYDKRRARVTRPLACACGYLAEANKIWSATFRVRQRRNPAQGSRQIQHLCRVQSTVCNAPSLLSAANKFRLQSSSKDPSSADIYLQSRTNSQSTNSITHALVLSCSHIYPIENAPTRTRGEGPVQFILYSARPQRPPSTGLSKAEHVR